MEETLKRILALAEERGLPFLLIGGNAVILLGFARNTIDIDLLVPAARRSAWLDAMRNLGYRLYFGSEAFAQFEPGETGGHAVDLMFVNERTWELLSAEPPEREVLGFTVRLPRPEHLVLLKIHAAASPDRSKPETDWEDVRQIFRACQLDCEDPPFRDQIVKFGGDAALQRIRSFKP